jgi:chromosomal replication initiation ATPase DnaA
MIPIAQLALDLPHRPALGRDDFLVASSNEAAVEWIDRWPAWPTPALVLYGPPGCGKTHLAQVWRTRSLAAEAAPGSLSLGAVPAFAGGKAAVVEAAERAPERALFHLYNLLAERDGCLLLTSLAPPARWKLRLPDLRSRLLASPAVAIGPPDDALVGAVLLKLFADRQLAVKDDVILYLLSRIERSFAAARRVVAALDRAALARRQKITVHLARKVLEAAGSQSADS